MAKIFSWLFVLVIIFVFSTNQTFAKTGKFNLPAHYLKQGRHCRVLPLAWRKKQAKKCFCKLYAFHFWRLKLNNLNQNNSLDTISNVKFPPEKITPLSTRDLWEWRRSLP